MRVITELTVDAKNKFLNDTFPLEYETLPKENEAIYSLQGNAFYLNKIIHKPHGGRMIPTVILDIKSDKTVLCG